MFYINEETKFCTIVLILCTHVASILHSHSVIIITKVVQSFTQWNSCCFLTLQDISNNKYLPKIISILWQLQKGIRFTVFLDDLLIMARSREDLEKQLPRDTVTPPTTGLCDQLGQVEALSNSADRVPGSPALTLSLPEEKVSRIVKSCSWIIDQGSISVRELSRLIGRMTATMMAVLPAQLCYRNLQRLKNQAFLRSPSFETEVELDQGLKEELQWWIECWPVVHFWRSSSTTAWMSLQWRRVWQWHWRYQQVVSNRSHQGFNCRYLASQQLKICYTGYGNGHDEWKNREELETLNAGGHELELYHLYNFCEELLTYQEHIKYKRPQC